MKEEPCKHVEGVDTGKRIRKNLLNIGVFIAEILHRPRIFQWSSYFTTRTTSFSSDCL